MFVLTFNISAFRPSHLRVVTSKLLGDNDVNFRPHHGRLFCLYSLPSQNMMEYHTENIQINPHKTTRIENISASLIFHIF